MRFRPTALARALMRRAALDDLMVTLAVARYAMRLLRLALGTPGEQRVADTLVAMLDEAHWALQELNRPRPQSEAPEHADR